MTMPIIGVGGLKTSGKDAFASVLEKHYGYHRRGMSDVLDEMLKATNPYIRVLPSEPHYGHFEAERVDRGAEFIRYRDLRRRVSYDESKRVQDVRRLLQTIGTEAGRTIIGEDVWTFGAKSSAGAIAKRLQNEGTPVVITGIRYPNELAMIRRLSGIALWIDRPSVTEAHLAAVEAKDPTALHSSENTLTAEDFQAVIYNRGTLEDLEQTAHDAIRYLTVDRGEMA